MEHFVNKYL